MFRFSVDAGKRSTDALPPVGGAQQSQVAVGGTESLPEWRRRRLGSSQHLCVQKQVGKTQGQVKSKCFPKKQCVCVYIEVGDPYSTKTQHEAKVKKRVFSSLS